MPIYEYVCNECGHEFDEFSSVADMDVPSACPECGSSSNERLVSRSSFQLKGAGWADQGYATTEKKGKR